MPSFVVTSPDGKEYDIEAPEGATQEQVLTFAQQQFSAQTPTAPQTKQVSYPDLSQTPNDNSMIENLGRGYLQGGKNAIMGTLQAGADVLGNQFPQNETIQGARELMAEAQGMGRANYQVQTGDSTAAGVGEFLGTAAPYALLPAGGASLAGRAALGAAGGALAGGTGATEENLTPEQALEQRKGGAMLGGAIGGVAPLAIAGAKPLVRKLAKINPTAAKDFLDEGTQVSLASLSDRPAIKQLDRFLSKFPGATGVIEENTSKTLDDIQKLVDAAGAAKGVTSQEAGVVIKGGAEKYVDRFNQVAGKLYNRLDDYLPADTKVLISSSTEQLQKELSGLPENLAKRKGANEGIKVLGDLVEDGKQGLDYSSLKKYRTIIGEKLSKPYLLGGEDEAVLKRAYGALTTDMEAAAAAKGDKALNAFKRANDFYKAGAKNIETNLQKVVQKDAPEQVYQAAISGAKLGGTRINGIMKSLNPAEREVVRGTVLKQLGGRGQDKFSTQTFLTEWNKLSPEAKTSLFGSTRESVDKIVRISGRINGLDRFSNPSGTGQHIAMGSLLLGGALIDGGAAIGSVAGSNLGARLVTNQSFVKWLAEESIKRATPKNINGAISGLTRIAKKEPSLAADLAKYAGVLTAVATRNDNEETK